MLTNKKRIRFALIGSGTIAKYHAEVIIKLNHIISVVLIHSKKQKNIDFCTTFNVATILTSLKELKNNTSNYDAIIICTPWYSNEQTLETILKFNLNKPILIEKPMVLSHTKLQNLQQKYNLSNILIGCNRRHYDFIPQLKNIISTSTIISVDVLSAEPFNSIDKSHNLADNMLCFYSIHIIDLLFELFGPLTLSSCQKIIVEEKKHYILTLFSHKNSCYIQIKILLDVAQNSYIKMYCSDKTIELLPIEQMRIYTKMEKRITDKNAVYTPKVDETYTTSSQFKPGFENQLKFFINRYIMNQYTSCQEFTRLNLIMALFDEINK